MSDPTEDPPTPGKDPFMERMEAIWAGQRARGHVPRTKEEIDAEIQQLRDEAEEEFLEVERLQEESERQRRELGTDQRPPP